MRKGSSDLKLATCANAIAYWAILILLILLVLLVLVTIPEGDPHGITANMLAPVIYHLPSSRAWQVVLEDVEYGIRHPLYTPDDEGEDD